MNDTTGKSMSEKLLPCPFCGEQPTEHINQCPNWNMYWLDCGKCGFEFEGNKDPRILARNWNTRYLQDTETKT